jgi:hypothetical protein
MDRGYLQVKSILIQFQPGSQRMISSLMQADQNDD